MLVVVAGVVAGDSVSLPRSWPEEEVEVREDRESGRERESEQARDKVFWWSVVKAMRRRSERRPSNACLPFLCRRPYRGRSFVSARTAQARPLICLATAELIGRVRRQAGRRKRRDNGGRRREKEGEKKEGKLRGFNRRFADKQRIFGIMGLQFAARTNKSCKFKSKGSVSVGRSGQLRLEF